jgi:hypothetical protein
MGVSNKFVTGYLRSGFPAILKIDLSIEPSTLFTTKISSLMVLRG